ncbi:MAG: hypothetical protein WBQ79_09390 [Acidobacteriaceae bacterium]
MSAFRAVAAKIRKSIRWSPLACLCLALLGVFAASPLLAQDHAMSMTSDHVPARLVQIVQDATRKYLNVNNATAAGYGPFLGCVTGPDFGAMGIHYVNGALLNGELNAQTPQALIYEPEGNRLRLVGVEFIVDADTWLKNNNSTPPVLEGQVLQLVAAPNRFNLPTFFELHVWAWQNNPLGAFVDWNTKVSCEHGGQ